MLAVADTARRRSSKDRRAPRFATFHVPPLGAHHRAWPRHERGEGDAVLLVRLLHAGGAQVLEDHLRERLRSCVLVALLGDLIDQVVVLIDAEDAVRGETLDGERAGDAGLLVFQLCTPPRADKIEVP